MSLLATLDHVHKLHRLGDQAVHALSDVCLEIDRGDFVAVVGPSGSGKSTLLSILGCLDQPSNGRYLLHGESVFAQSKSRLSELRNRRIGIVFQNFNLLPRLTALENVALPLFYRREPLRNPAAKARAVLEAVGLGARMHHMPSQLSGASSSVLQSHGRSSMVPTFSWPTSRPGRWTQARAMPFSRSSASCSAPRLPSCL